MIIFILAMIILSISGTVIYFDKQIRNLNARLDEIGRKDAIEAATKFRIRTDESDPNRQATVKPARIRAIKYITPPPRR